MIALSSFPSKDLKKTGMQEFLASNLQTNPKSSRECRRFIVVQKVPQNRIPLSWDLSPKPPPNQSAYHLPPHSFRKPRKVIKTTNAPNFTASNFPYRDSVATFCHFWPSSKLLLPSTAQKEETTTPRPCTQEVASLFWPGNISAG